MVKERSLVIDTDLSATFHSHSLGMKKLSAEKMDYGAEKCHFAKEVSCNETKCYYLFMCSYDSPL